MAYAWGTTGAPRGQQVTILAQDAVIVRLLGGVGENLVRLSSLLELGLGARFLVGVRVVLLCQLEVLLFYVALGSGAGGGEDLVGVAF